MLPLRFQDEATHSQIVPDPCTTKYAVVKDMNKNILAEK